MRWFARSHSSVACRVLKLAVAGLLLTLLGAAGGAGRLTRAIARSREGRSLSTAFPNSEGLADNAAVRPGSPQTTTDAKTTATVVSAATESIPTPPADITVATEQPAAAPCGCRSVRPGDQIWLISTRCLGCPADNVEPAYEIVRYDDAGWQTATLQDFLAADNWKLPTDFYIHGNFETAGGARRRTASPSITGWPPASLPAARSGSLSGRGRPIRATTKSN